MNNGKDTILRITSRKFCGLLSAELYLCKNDYRAIADMALSQADDSSSTKLIYVDASGMLHST